MDEIDMAMKSGKKSERRFAKREVIEQPKLITTGLTFNENLKRGIMANAEKSLEVYGAIRLTRAEWMFLLRLESPRYFQRIAKLEIEYQKRMEQDDDNR